jgi:radical SAM protein (TIGR01212 family)
VLREKYDSALIDERIVALAVATRPDCIDEDVVKLLKEYSQKYYVYVELGLQTANEKVAQKFNRGYSNEEFVRAVKLLNDYDIDVVTHIMVGLPYEEANDVRKTVELINSLKIMGVKIHSTYIIKNTELEKLYKEGKYLPITLEYYVDNVCNMISHLRPDIVVCRITGDAPKDILIEPKWNARKKIVLNSINRALDERNIFQGDRYKLK